MQTTSLGFKKPEDTDVADLRIFVGDNMDLLNSKLDLLNNNAPSKNYIINGNFDIWQRNVTFSSPSSIYTSDRFLVNSSVSSAPSPVHTRQVLALGAINNSYYYYNIAVTGAGSVGTGTDFYTLSQKVENGTRLLCGSGRNVTIAFYAKSDISGKKLGVGLIQGYGTGGSPTTAEHLTGGQIVSLTSNWTRYVVTIPTNTLTGKTFGTNNDDSLQLNFGIAYGATTAATRYGGSSAETFGASGNISIAQVQLYSGDIAPTYSPRTVEEELRSCQRYYEKSYPQGIFPAAVSSLGATRMSFPNSGNYGWIGFKVTKRLATPTVTYYSTTSGSSGVIRNVSSSTDISATSINQSDGATVVNFTIVASSNYDAQWTVDAEL